MLLSFRFANHRSFRDEQQLNLTPVYPADAKPARPDPAVRVAGIFGANASGKSNALHALTFMRHLALSSDREVEPGLGLSNEPFRLNRTHANEPSRYVVDLLLDGVRHTYGFTIDSQRVLEEWLYTYPYKKKRCVFERDGDNFSWGEESGKQGELARIAGITSPTALFLSTAMRFALSGHVSPHDQGTSATSFFRVYLWFRRLHVRTRSDGRPDEIRLALAWPEDERDRMILINILRAADLGISDVIASRLDHISPTPSETSTDDIRGNPWSRIHEFVADLTTHLNRPIRRLRFSHKGADGDIQLDFQEESAGTKQLLYLSMSAIEALRFGALMTVDEIDASLHPMLTAKLINLFQAPTTNPRGSQLIFTSHDATLLGTFDAEEVLRRDQIWFTEKDEEGASTLYPLTDFKPRRTGENRPRRYLNGNYGGVPDLSADLFEQALVGRGEFDAQATS